MPSHVHVGKADNPINGCKLCRESNPPSNQFIGIISRLSRLKVEYTFLGGYAKNPYAAAATPEAQAALPGGA